MYRNNTGTIYELSTFLHFYPLPSTAQTVGITAVRCERGVKMFLFTKQIFINITLSTCLILLFGGILYGNKKKDAAVF